MMVVTFKNASALVVAPTEVPSRITTIYIRALLAVSASCFTTPLSRNRLPNISIPTRGAVDGRIRHTTMVTMMGNRIFSSLDTGQKLFHLNLTLFLSCQKLHKWRLDNWNQRHVGVSRNRDRSHDLGLSQPTAQEQGCRAVRTADDGDGC